MPCACSGVSSLSDFAIAVGWKPSPKKRAPNSSAARPVPMDCLASSTGESATGEPACTNGDAGMWTMSPVGQRSCSLPFTNGLSPRSVGMPGDAEALMVSTCVAKPRSSIDTTWP